MGERRDVPRETMALTSLTPRELECLALVAEGLTDKEIACHLRISAHTVAHVVAAARHKLGASSRAHAVALLFREPVG